VTLHIRLIGHSSKDLTFVRYEKAEGDDGGEQRGLAGLPAQFTDRKRRLRAELKFMRFGATGYERREYPVHE
jgi:hypothetical protein